MEVILQEDVPHLGHIGDIVKVRNGYARNYLFPRKLAILADKRNIRELEHNQRIVAEKKSRVENAAQDLAQKIAGAGLVFAMRAGEGGKLFGSVTNLDIEKQLAEKGFDIDRRRIKLAEPIKSVGEHSVSLTLSAGVPCEIAVKVEPLDTGEDDVPADDEGSGDAPAGAAESDASTSGDSPT